MKNQISKSDMIIEAFHKSEDKSEDGFLSFNDICFYIKDTYNPKHKNELAFKSSIRAPIQLYCKGYAYFKGKEIFIKDESEKLVRFKLSENYTNLLVMSHSIKKSSDKPKYIEKRGNSHNNVSTRYDTREELRTYVIKESGYLCFLCNSKERTKEMSFKTKGNLYLESHHILPM